MIKLKDFKCTIWSKIYSIYGAPMWLIKILPKLKPLTLWRPAAFGTGLKPLDGRISLKFLLETRPQSESFDTLDDLLGLQVQKL